MRPRPNDSEAFPRRFEAPTTSALHATRTSHDAREWPRLVFLGLTLARLACWDLGSCSAWLVGRRLGQARRLMDADRFAEARQWLVGAPLTVVKKLRGGLSPRSLRARRRKPRRPRSTAWERVEPRSSWAGRAGLARPARWSAISAVSATARRSWSVCWRTPRPEREEVRHTLTELYFWEGRRDSARRLLEAYWSTASDPVLELRDHWRIENFARPARESSLGSRSGSPPRSRGRSRLARAGQPGDAVRPVRRGMLRCSTVAATADPTIPTSGGRGSTGRAPP